MKLGPNLSNPLVRCRSDDRSPFYDILEITVDTPGKVIVGSVVIVPSAAPWITELLIDHQTTPRIFQVAINEGELGSPAMAVGWPLILLGWIQASVIGAVGLGVTEHNHL